MKNYYTPYATKNRKYNPEDYGVKTCPHCGREFTVESLRNQGVKLSREQWEKRKSCGCWYGRKKGIRPEYDFETHQPMYRVEDIAASIEEGFTERMVYDSWYE